MKNNEMISFSKNPKEGDVHAGVLRSEVLLGSNYIRTLQRSLAHHARPSLFRSSHPSHPNPHPPNCSVSSLRTISTEGLQDPEK